MIRSLDILDRFSVKILRFLSGEPLSNFYQREISRKTGVSIGKTNQVLRALEREGIVLNEKRGKVNLYRYNLHNPASRQLKITFTLLELGDLVQRLRDISRRVVLYGSCAEGQDTSQSDVDLLIVTDDREKATKAVNWARRTLDRRVSPLVLTLAEFSHLKSSDQPLFRQINKGIVLWREE